jgi:hypothetical protein
MRNVTVAVIVLVHNPSFSLSHNPSFHKPSWGCVTPLLMRDLANPWLIEMAKIGMNQNLM